MHALLATRLKNNRKELGWSQKELAEGICQQTQISRMEQGKYMPGADLLYKLSEKMGLNMDYFFSGEISKEFLGLSAFKRLSETLLENQDYASLKYAFEGERKQQTSLSFDEKIYLDWIDAILTYQCEHQLKLAISKIEDILSRISIDKVDYLYILNTLLIFLGYDEDKEKFERLYDQVSVALSKIDTSVREQIELYIKIKYNYCYHLWKQEEMDKSRALLLEIIEFCNKYHSSFRLADLYCLLGNVTENLDISVAKDYYMKAKVLYLIENNEVMALKVEQYLMDKQSENV